jgi:hypothetical protein
MRQLTRHGWPKRLAALGGGGLVLAAALAGCTGKLGFGDGAGADGGTSGGETPGPVTLPGGVKLAGKPNYYRAVRLTHEQWENSVRDLFGFSEPTGLSSAFVPDPPSGKFQNNEKALYVSDTLRADYQRAAEALAERVARDPAALARLGASDDVATFLRALGRRVYRRPLSPTEEARYQALYASGKEFFASGDDFADGVQTVLEAMLQSPHFVYRIELTPDGERLSGYELATKLSLLLRDTAPDEAMLAAAESGEFDTDEGVIAYAEQLLADPAATGVLERFHGELFGLQRYKSILKSTTLFPTYTEDLNDTLLAADLLYFRRMFESGFGLREILTSDIAYVDEATAPFYGLTASGPELREVTLDASRPGFFTRLGFLAYNGTLRDPDPIHRGVDINNRVLCVQVEPPPGEIPALPDYVPGQTNRERVTAHTGVGVCGNCHNGIINPPGFALEGFDAMGQARSTDNGKPVDTSGEYYFNDVGLQGFQGIEDLTALLSESLQVHGCYAANLTEFALGRDVAGGEAELVSGIQQESLDGNGSIKEIMRAIVRSPQFVTSKGGTP